MDVQHMPGETIHLEISQADTKKSFADSAIGQATAVLAVIAAAIYLTGAVSLGLKLWFLQFPWTPVLGQIPRDYIITISTGQVILPSLIAGIIAGFMIDISSIKSHDPWKVRAYWTQDPWRHLIYVATVIFVDAVFITIPLMIVEAKRQGLAFQTLRPTWDIVACVAILVSIAPPLVLWRLVKHYRSAPGASGMLRRAWTIALVTIAIIPCAVCISGALLLPHVKICGPSFVHYDRDGAPHKGYLNGTLIAISDTQAYLAVFHWVNGTDKIVGRTVTVVPLSSVGLQSIGPPQYTSCQQLTT
jgi:hypothetical protein